MFLEAVRIRSFEPDSIVKFLSFPWHASCLTLIFTIWHGWA